MRRFTRLTKRLLKEVGDWRHACPCSTTPTLARPHQNATQRTVAAMTTPAMALGVTNPRLDCADSAALL